MIVKCPQCPYEATPYSVKRHMRSIHRSTDDAIKQFNDGLKNGSSKLTVSIVCQLCSETFESKKAYAEHSKTHSKKSKFVKCGFCSYTTTDPNQMHSHAMDCVASPYTNCYIGSREERISLFSCNVCNKKFENRNLMGKHFENEHSDIQSYVDKKFENMTKYKEWFYEINKSAEETLSVRSSRQIRGFKRLYLRCQTDCRRPIPLQSSRLEEKPIYVHHYCPAYLIVTECRKYVRVQGIVEHIHKEDLDDTVIENVKEKNEENHQKCLAELEGVVLDELEEGQWQIGDEIINYNGNCQCPNKNTHCETCDCCSSNFSCSCSHLDIVPCIHMHFLSMKIRNDKNKKQEESLLMVTRHKRTDNSQEEVIPLTEEADDNNTGRFRKRKLKSRISEAEDSTDEEEEVIDGKRRQKSFRFRKLGDPSSRKTKKRIGNKEVLASDNAEVSRTPVVDAHEKETVQTVNETQNDKRTVIDDVEALFADLIHDTATDPAPLVLASNEECDLFSVDPLFPITPSMANEMQQPLDISTEVLSNLSSLTEHPLPESILEDSFSGL